MKGVPGLRYCITIFFSFVLVFRIEEQTEEKQNKEAGEGEMIDGNSKGNIFWPIINDETSAREAAKQGWYAALFCGGATLIAVILKSSPYSSLFDVAIICLIGFGCLKMSRIASTLGLTYTIFNAGYKYAVHSTLGIMPLFIIFFINAMRGSFKFHAMKKKVLSESEQVLN